MKEISDGNYMAEINSQDLCVVDFYANWCMPCMRMENEVNHIDETNADVSVYKFNVDKGVGVWSKVKEEFSVRSIPFLVFYRNGKPIHSTVGYKNAGQIQEILDNLS